MKMVNKCIIFCLLLIIVNSQAQAQTEWDFYKVPPRGLFNDFNDLKYNRSNGIKFTSTRPNYGTIEPYKGFDDLFVVKDKNGRQLQNIYAFSNGYDLYVRGAFVGGYKGYFAPAKTRGRYLFFEYANKVDGGGVVGANGVGIIIPGGIQVKYFVLDTQTGKSMNLTKFKTIKRMFKDYPKLRSEMEGLRKIDQGYRSVKRLQINKTYCRLVQQLNDQINDNQQDRG